MEELRVKISVKILPSDYTCDGQDISPEIDVGGVNTKIARCLAIIVNDPDAPGGGGFVHWIAWNMELVRLIPEKIPRGPVVSFPLKVVQGKNSFGKIGYNGPCPPHGQTHRYFFKVYGLDTELSLPAGPQRTSSEGDGRACCPVWRDLRDIRTIGGGLLWLLQMTVLVAPLYSFSGFFCFFPLC